MSTRDWQVPRRRTGRWLVFWAGVFADDEHPFEPTLRQAWVVDGAVVRAGLGAMRGFDPARGELDWETPIPKHRRVCGSSVGAGTIAAIAYGTTGRDDYKQCDHVLVVDVRTGEVTQDLTFNLGTQLPDGVSPNIVEPVTSDTLRMFDTAGFRLFDLDTDTGRTQRVATLGNPFDHDGFEVDFFPLEIDNTFVLCPTLAQYATDAIGYRLAG